MNYPSIRIEGAILSPDILSRLEELPGQTPVDFGLEPSVRVKDEIARAWADAQDYWRIFQRRIEALKDDGAATTETRQLWIVPLLGLLGYQVEYQQRGVELNGKVYALSHRAVDRAYAPVQIIGYHEPAGLDRKPERANLRMSAHAMVQEFLNLNDQLYGLVTNGRVLRLLRDSSRLIKLSYLEFDLDRIFTDGLFADFAVLYRLLHATRLPGTNETTGASWIERYHQDALEQGTRIRDGLRAAVTEALERLGTGFVAHPDNGLLREQITAGTLDAETYFGCLLRLIYRLLFLNVVEERGLIFPAGAAPDKRNAYSAYYSVQRLRRLARTRGLRSERSCDAYLSLLATFQIFERPEQAARFGATAFGGQLFDPSSLGPLANCRLSNAALFQALDRLCAFDDPRTGQRLPVNFGALATEEFGSVYESLLELHAIIQLMPAPWFGFKQAAGNERKTSGSYYTPASLVDCLLDSALDPVLDDRIRNHARLGYISVEEAILSLKVCDPACGSGHFLIAAGQRIARTLATVRSGGDEPSPEQLRHALRQVIGRCLYGVDLNPMSVELCRVALWLEGVEPGKPLSFLDHHIQCGNSLIGATPSLIGKGIPDVAFKPIEGDDTAACAAFRKRNQDAARGQGDLFAHEPRVGALKAIAADLAALYTIGDDTVSAVAEQIARYEAVTASDAYSGLRLTADAWTASFVWRKTLSDLPLTEQEFRAIENGKGIAATPTAGEIRRLSQRYGFFHWHIAFPEVFTLPSGPGDTAPAGWSGGFDVVLGNPPWEHIELKEKEWFAERRPEIAEAQTGASRKRLIEELAKTDPKLSAAYNAAKRLEDGLRHFASNSGLYPKTGRGRINTYAVFAELLRNLISPTGRVGCIVPSGIATDDTTKYFFQELMDTRSLISLYDFENRKGLFPGVHRSYKFCLLTLAGAGRLAERGAEFVFFAHETADLDDAERRFTLSREDIALLNPNTRTCPIFRSKRDAELTKAIYRRVPILIREAQGDQPEENPWGVKFRQGLFNMTSDSHLFRTREQLEADGWVLEGNVFRRDGEAGNSELGNSELASRVGEAYLPLYEAKMIHHYDHRWATYDGLDTRDLPLAEKNDPSRVVMGRYWVRETDVQEALANTGWRRGWLLGWRDITNTTNERTVIFSIMPPIGVGHTCPIMLSSRRSVELGLLLTNLTGYAHDFSARQKIGGTHLTYGYLVQLPILPPTVYDWPCPWDNGLTGQTRRSAPTIGSFLLPRALELTYTAWDLESFARDCGYDGPPFRWDEDRRFLLRCELDAAFFHLYGIKRYDVDYIMDTFPIVKRKDEQRHGEYRTKRVILEMYDEMKRAMDTGVPYATRLEPGPADARVAHEA